jgi:hypothetical protein
MRLKASSYGTFDFYQSVALTQYAPNILRSIILAKFGGSSTWGPYLAAGNNAVWNYQSNPSGMLSVSAVTDSASAGTHYPIIADGTGNMAGDYVDVPWCSLARCMLVDNGTNLLLRSDDFTTTWSVTRATASANLATDPLGGATADVLTEDSSAATTHYITQAVTVASTAADFSFSIALKAGSINGNGAGGFAVVLIRESTSNHDVYVYVNLSTGALGTASTSGANWSNARAFVSSLGSGWYRVSIVGRKASAATTLTTYAMMATDIATNTFTGTATATTFLWRGTLAQSSVPTRLAQTTSAAITESVQSGSTLYVKGLPASTSGLLLMGDVVESNGELLQLTAQLDSDASGLGVLQFAPTLFNSPFDNAPIVVTAPMPKLKLVENPKWSNEWGVQSDLELTFEQYYE